MSQTLTLTVLEKETCFIVTDENKVVYASCAGPDAHKRAHLIAEGPSLLDSLKQEAKFLKSVAALIEARNGKESVLAQEMAQPFRVRAFGLEKLVARATGEPCSN